MVTRDSVIAALVGTTLGTAGALVASRLLAPTLVRVSPRDPTVFANSVVVLAVVTLVAAILPSIRATRVDPMETLRG